MCRRVSLHYSNMIHDQLAWDHQKAIRLIALSVLSKSTIMAIVYFSFVKSIRSSDIKPFLIPQTIKQLPFDSGLTWKQNKQQIDNPPSVDSFVFSKTRACEQQHTWSHIHRFRESEWCSVQLRLFQHHARRFMVWFHIARKTHYQRIELCSRLGKWHVSQQQYSRVTCQIS